jgi:peptide-methionine (R)-S-oxide reductase
MENNEQEKVIKTEAEWKEILTPEVFHISRQKGTERPFTSKYEDAEEVGTFNCIACSNPLFKSNAKFSSGCGWPSFFEPITKTSILYEVDNTHGMHRTEVMCGKCKGHLGHVFEDGPQPTGLRYCINGVILNFEEEK